jgi:hypothetical protein
MRAKYLFFLALLCLYSCSNKIEMTETTKAQSSQNNYALNSSRLETKVVLPVKVIGEFSNVKSNGEHQWGYSIELWKQGENIYGLFSGNSSPIIVGDPPTGILENQVFSLTSGDISFKTKLPDFTYEFDGILTKEEIKGNLLNNITSKTEKITLKRSKEWSDGMEDFHSYEEWKNYADKILMFRGSKP